MVKFWEWKSLLHHPLVCQKKESLKRKWVNIIEIVFSFCQRGLTRQSRLGESRRSPSQTVIWVPGRTSLRRRPRQLSIVSRGINGQEWSVLLGSILMFDLLPFSSQREPSHEHLGTLRGKIKELKQNKQLSSVNWKMGFPYRMSDKLCRQHSWAKALGPLFWVWPLSTKML